MNLHIIMHESFEAPGAIEQWAQDRGQSVSYTRLYQGDRFPEHQDFDFLVIMGGPQSPVTTLDECPHFDAAREIAFIKSAIDANKKLLGVCLGAQLIGEALGAKFDHSPNREIGVFEITLTDEAKNDPIFSTFPEKFPVGHWHGDMPGLTPNATVLAYSAGCPRQVVRYTPRVWGFQCHLEFTPDCIEGMLAHCGHELEQYKDLPYIETPEQLRAHDYRSMNELLFRFLDYMSALQRMRRVKRDIVSAMIFSRDGKFFQGKKDPARGGVYSDAWHIPGGGIEEGEDKITALIREVKEETGINISGYPIELIRDDGHGESERTMEDGERVICEMSFNDYKVVINDKDASDIEVFLNDDLVEYAWHDQSELKDVTLTPPAQELFSLLGYL